MAVPTRNSIILGTAFVLVGLVKALCDRWQLTIKVPGSKMKQPHFFDHMFIMWLLKQILQLALLPLYHGIQTNFMGLGRLKHGEIQPKTRARSHFIIGRPNENENLTDEVGNQGAEGLHAQIQDNPNIQVEGENGGNVQMHVQDIQMPHEQDEDIQPEGQGERGPGQDDNVEQKQLLKKQSQRNRKPSWLIYFPPAFFTQADVLLLYFGLKLTYPSSFIMLKGTVAFFTALLSMAFLAQQLACYMWFGVAVATLGFAVSGISDYIHPPYGGYEKYGIAAGDLLIVMAQIMFATKIIYEEKFIRKHSIHPMVFLGSEAVYGFVFATILFIVFNLVDAVQYSYLPNQKLEDVQDAAIQLYNSWQVQVSALGSLLCYIVYTYLGLFLIRDQGALARIMIETLIWTFYWLICLLLHWETFFIGQIPGLCVIVIGTLIYSHILLIPFVSRQENIDNANFTFANIQARRHQEVQPQARNENEVDGDDVNLLDAAEPMAEDVNVEVHRHDDDDDDELLNPEVASVN